MKINITSYLSTIILLTVLSLNSQNLKIHSNTITTLEETGLDFKKHEKGFVFLYQISENSEIEKTTITTYFQLLKMEDDVKIDDELPEGIYKWILSVTKPIWECNLEGYIKHVKGNLLLFQSNEICDNIPSELIPGGDQFIPGGDQFIPGGDQFIKSKKAIQELNPNFKYFLKISMEGEHKINSVLLPLKVNQ